MGVTRSHDSQLGSPAPWQVTSDTPMLLNTHLFHAQPYKVQNFNFPSKLQNLSSKTSRIQGLLLSNFHKFVLNMNFVNEALVNSLMSLVKSLKCVWEFE